MTHPFPHTMDFSGYNAPSRIECNIYDLIVEGNLPPDINGSWFRCIPDPQYPPMAGKDTYLSGDGMVSLFRFEAGHVDFKMRYIQTERWQNERAARRSLYGIYRNPYTDDPSVKGKGRAAANTTPVWHGGRLLATKEDDLPWELDPKTLATIGPYTWDGKLRSKTVTAHPRLDPDTGELFFFGYEAAGLATKDVAYCIADINGNLVHEEWFEAPFVSLMHDFIVTKEFVIFPVPPITCDLERLKAGGAHWVWEPAKGMHFGIMPRYGSAKHMRWFHAPPLSAFHFMNAFSDGNKIHIDFNPSKIVAFPFILEASNIQLKPEDMRGPGYARWTFDLGKPGEGHEEAIIGPGGDMPRTAERDQMHDYDVGYIQGFTPPREGKPLLAGPVGPGFNTIHRLEVKTGRHQSLFMDGKSTVQEHIHIPSKTPGHEGYLAFVVDRHAENQSDVMILEAEHIEKGPIATIKLPLRLRCQVHGSWVAA